MSNLTGSATLDHRLRAGLGLFRASMATALWGGSQALYMRFRPNAPTWLPMRAHRGVCRALGLTIDVHGQQAGKKGVLFVANHISWADIPVLGSMVMGTFVAKAEVSGMGLFGRLSDLQHTIYVDRERRSATHSQRTRIAQRMADGHNIILFPEGTSSNGTHVLPFKSSLFAVAEAPDQDVLIQPVTIAYTHINGMRINRSNRYRIAWVGDMDLVPHAWELMGVGRIRVSVQFHDPVRRSAFADRKALARHCEHVVSEGLRLANSGRL